MTAALASNDLFGRAADGTAASASTIAARTFAGAALLLLKNRTRTGQSVAFGMNQALNVQRQFYVATAIEPLAGSAFVGLELRKLRLQKRRTYDSTPHRRATSPILK